MAWPAFLTAAIFVAFGTKGFSPSDEGYVLSQARRLLQGQVPHRDFLASKPVGSALLHVLDFALPGPLLEVSRLFGLVELVTYSLLLGFVVLRLAPWRLGLVAGLGVAASVLINLHTFQMMAWQTTDGLLLVAAGLVLLDRGLARGSRASGAAGLLLLGAAVLTKQSFAPAGLLGLLLVARWGSGGLRQRGRAVLLAGALMALPGSLYVAVIALLGGLRPMVVQLASSPRVNYGTHFRTLLAAPAGRLEVGAEVLLLLGLVGAERLLARRGARDATALLLGLAPRAGLTLLWVFAALHQQLGGSGTGWGFELLEAALLVLAWQLAARRRLDIDGLLLVTVAWMASLSVGWAVPNLAAGSLLLYSVHRVWAGAQLPAWGLGGRAAVTAGAVVLFAWVSATFVAARTDHPYRDVPVGRLDHDLGALAPAFGGIRTGPNTYRYLADVKACIATHPARWVAALPDNPALYPAFDMNSPFPVDWFDPVAYAGSEERLYAAVDRLNRDGNYLVMFQVYDPDSMYRFAGLAPAAPDSPILGGAVTRRVRDGLRGSRTTCGVWVAVYSR